MADNTLKLHLYEIRTKGSAVELHKAIPPRQFTDSISGVSLVRSGCTPDSALIAVAADGHVYLLDSGDNSCRAQLPVAEYDCLLWLHTKSNCTQPRGAQMMLGAALDTRKIQLWGADTLFESGTAELPPDTATIALTNSTKLIVGSTLGGVHVLEATKGPRDREAVVKTKQLPGSYPGCCLGMEKTSGLLCWVDQGLGALQPGSGSLVTVDADGVLIHEFSLDSNCAPIVHIGEELTVVCSGSKAVMCRRSRNVRSADGLVEGSNTPKEKKMKRWKLRGGDHQRKSRPQ